MARRRTRVPRWAEYTTEKLLELRFCDLGLRLEDSPLWERVERLYDELEQREIHFRPHCWLAEEWFSPDGVPGIAIPFYLAHPRLTRLEKQQMLEAEGGNEDWCMKILRHEAGHTLDTAYRLHRRQRFREAFGKVTDPYPEYYQPKPYSRSYVLHLDLWYAQSHPAEDFAETFAVWLRPRSRWRSQYQEWPALAKLEYVDELMDEIAGKSAAVRSTRHVEPIRDSRKTLAEHYAEKRQRYLYDTPPIHDRELRRLFSDAPEHAKRPSAAAFLRRIRVKLRRVVGHWTGQYQYVINQVLGEMIDRCRDLNLRLATPARQAERDALVMVTVQTMNYLHAGHHRLAL
ncbi:MAG: putative zinc-binding metallopeptidase [Pirellulales bacterium]